MTTARLARRVMCRNRSCRFGPLPHRVPGRSIPLLRGVQPADWPVVAALLDLAVAMGRPVPREGIMHTLGYPEPPPTAALTAGAGHEPG